ncbi:MAG: phosphoribosylformylglycinamidine cyclo-ligase, partial [Clostridia bacterium]|nr:phosphoribosylformylglycinamidine cyclo-ligase [Clostridia bacterium]
RAVELMKKHVRSTFIPGVCEDIGGFGGLFMPDLTGMKTPVLVSGTDGVGTKLKIAFEMGVLDTVGVDCVAMCVNDVAVCGAKPLFFLDYVACGKNVPERIADIVSGVAEGCRQAGCALIGGETAEMPGFYPEEEYDLAGFSVGIVDRERILDKEKVQKGDVLVGLASTGAHSNGFSLIRRLVKDVPLDSAFEGATLGETLLRPTRIYVKPLLALVEKGLVKSAAHITGGGFYENIPRSLPENLCAVVEKKALTVPPIFRYLQSLGDVPERDMFNTFNMGTGMTLVTAEENADEAIRALQSMNVEARVIGHIEEGKGVVMQ